MSNRGIGLLLLLSVMCIFAGTLVGLDGFRGGTSISIEALLAQDYTGSSLQGLAAFVAAVPDQFVYYAGLVDAKLLGFVTIAVLAMLMAVLSVRRAVAISREEARNHAPRKPLWSFRKRTRNWSRLFARVPFIARVWSVDLHWRIDRAIAGLIFVVGLLVSGTVYRFANEAFRNQADERALTIARNLSHAAGLHMEKGNYLALRTLVSKYALPDHVAYALVQDHRGRVLAHSMKILPREVAQSLSTDDLQDIKRSTANLPEEEVYDTRVPILEGQNGAVHVGILKSAVEKEIRWELLRLVLSVLGIVLAGAAISVSLARSITRPLHQLSRVADEMSKGNLNVPIEVKAKDEVQDLALSLENMRVTLKAAILRLEQGWGSPPGTSRSGRSFKSGLSHGGSARGTA